MIPILSINGSDSIGLAGIQSDIKTVKDLGAYSVTAITSVTIQNLQGIESLNELPADVIIGQIRAVYDVCHPKAVKVGMVGCADAVSGIRNEIVGCQNIVSSPTVFSSDGTRLMDDDTLSAVRRWLVPETKVLVMKCVDAEAMLGITIDTDDDMVRAAKMLADEGAELVMLRGRCADERVTALLYGAGCCEFFSSYNVEGWQRHGIGGALSTAIAVRLAFGDDPRTAVSNAHEYLHSQIVYAVDADDMHPRSHEIYNGYLSLIADCYRQQHEVSYYADRLNITTRYLSQVTRQIARKSPKQILDEYLLEEAKRMLLNSQLPIQDIARHLGFTSQLTFTRMFKNKEGVSPRSVRVGKG